MKQNSMKVICFVMYAIIASINATTNTRSNGDEVNALKNRVTALENKLTTSNLMLSQIYKKFTTMEADMKLSLIHI